METRRDPSICKSPGHHPPIYLAESVGHRKSGVGLDSGAVVKEGFARLLEFYQGQGKPGIMACDCNPSSPLLEEDRELEEALLGCTARTWFKTKTKATKKEEGYSEQLTMG